MTKRQKDILGIWIIAITVTPMLIVLVIGAALSLAGCAQPGVVCEFGWGV